MVFTPKYRGKILVGEVAEAAEEIIREICKELDIKIIDMAVNADHVHLFIKYPPKYSVSFIAKRIKGESSKLLREKYPYLKGGALIICGLQVVFMDLSGKDGR
jgi:putative transposase